MSEGKREIMFCNKCGAELKPGMKFCENCGQPVALAAPKVPVQPVPQAQPVAPKAPVQPVPQAQPAAPKAPVQPAPQAQPVAPKAPVQPAPQAQPVAPKTPVQPAPQAQPVAPKAPAHAKATPTAGKKASDDPQKKLGMIIGGAGLLVAALIIIAAFFMAGGPKPKCPVVPDTVMVQEDVTAYLNEEFAPDDEYEYDEEEAETALSNVLTVSAVTVLENDLTDEDDDKRAEVLAEVVVENAHYRQTRTYYLDYKKYSEVGWRMKSINAGDNDDWITIPKAGVTDEIVKKQLSDGSETTVNGRYVWVSEENLGNVTIDSRNTDLENGYETVNVTYEIISGVANCKRDAVLTYEFRGTQWKFAGMTMGTLEEISYNEGYAFDASEDRIKSDIYATPVVLDGNYGDQQVTVDENTIANFVAQAGAYDWDSQTVQVQASFNVVKKLATLKVEANLTYVYTGNGWNVDRIKYTPVVENVTITGDWKGYYTTWGKKPTLVLSITSQDAENMLKGSFAFGPSANAPDYESGSFSIIGGVELDNLSVNIKGSEWIDRPGSFSMVNLNGMLLIDDAKISNNRNFEVTLIQ